MNLVSLICLVPRRLPRGSPALLVQPPCHEIVSADGAKWATIADYSGELADFDQEISKQGSSRSSPRNAPRATEEAKWRFARSAMLASSGAFNLPSSVNSVRNLACFRSAALAESP